MSEHKPLDDTKIGILIAEDSPVQAAQLRFLLEQNGYRVTVAGDGVQALDSLAHEIPALVISDIMMPEMDGFTLCARIKADARTRQIPVILLTSLTNKEDLQHGLDCGARLYIAKPYHPQDLLAQINKILAE